MAVSVRGFVRHSSLKSLQEYFGRRSFMVSGIDWEQPEEVAKHQIIQRLASLTSQQMHRFIDDIERIMSMVDREGQAALASVVCPVEPPLSAYEYSQWVYLNALECFRHAETIRYLDQYRYGAQWSSYLIPQAAQLSLDEVSLSLFKDRLCRLFGWGCPVTVDVFQRRGKDHKVVTQIMVNPELGVEVEPLHQRITGQACPLVEYAVLYCAEQGSIEVVATTGLCREHLVRAFSETLMPSGNQLPVPLPRHYSLSPLLEQTVFAWDPEDRIDSVNIQMMTFEDCAGDGLFSVEVPSHQEWNFHSYCDAYFRRDNPLKSGMFRPIKARLAIRFRPERDDDIGKVLPVTISLPNECDLYSRTESERQVGEKYLRRWGIIQDEPVTARVAA